MILRVREPNVTGIDDFGNWVTAYAERDWPVRGIAPGAIADPMLPNRDASTIAWTVYAPPEAAPTRFASVLVGVLWHEVNGEPSDWTLGPDGPGGGGIVVELKTVTG